MLAESGDLAEAVRMIRSHGRAGTGDEALVLGLTGRLDTLQAAILLAKIEVFDEELVRRRAIASRYSAALGNVVAVPSVPPGYESAFALYTIRVRDRDRVRAKLDEMGVGTGLFYRLALHQHPAFRDVADASAAGFGAPGQRGAEPAHPSRPPRRRGRARDRGGAERGLRLAPGGLESAEDARPSSAAFNPSQERRQAHVRL